MSQFRVTITSTKQIAAITHDGYVARHVEFGIQRMSDRRTYSYEGHAGGRQFELRLQLLVGAGGVLVEADDPKTSPAELAWKEGVVNQALLLAEGLQETT